MIPKNRRLSTLLLTLALATMLALPTLVPQTAQAQNTDAGPPDGGDMRGMRAIMGDLTDKQREQIEALQREQREKIRAKREAMQPHATAMREALQAFPINSASAREHQEALQRLRGELFTLNLEHQIKVQQIVGEQNWAKLIAARRGPRGGEDHGRRPKPGERGKPPRK